jgi:N-acetylglucosamine-6-sulfatase
VGSLRRNRPLQLAAIACLLVVVGLLLRGPAGSTATADGGQDRQAASGQPNFLHILTDDQTIDSLRYMKRTERLLGGKGTSFTDYNVVQPLCCPSRATFLSGQYPHNHGVLENLPPYGYGAMDFNHTIYTSLHDAGYRTGWVGKVLNTAGPTYGLQPEPGFDEWLVPLDATELNMFDYEVSDNGTDRKVTGAFQSTFLAKRAHEFLDTPSDQPFMLTLALTNPHWSRCSRAVFQECPPDPAPRDLGKYRNAKFPFGPDFTGSRKDRTIANHYWRRELESMQSADRIVASLIAQLRRNGQLDNTYVIFQSDNGLEHGEHGIFDKNVPWDRSVRVPLIIRGPGFEPGATRSDLTANVDIPATILDAANVPPPLPPDGHSLLGDYRRKYLLLERQIGMPNRPHRDPWRQIKSADGWAYWRDLSTGVEHLYDMKNDPYQTRNLAGVRPAVTNRLNAEMRKVAFCADPCP